VNGLGGMATTTELLVKIGVSFRNVEKWSRGETLPRFEKAKLIFDFTNNEVTGHDFYEKQIQRHQANL
jgi:transcriptional regulator with XRE-family HTH domain